MKSFIIGTAGHVDHGKTTLVKALTGIDADRLPEEKKRGMSIELGYAPLRLSHDVILGIVDVPGHENLIKTMVMGAAQIDLVLFLVAANEGMKPQSREHLHILSLLKIPHGIIVITKKDLVEIQDLERISQDIRKECRGTFLENAPFVYSSHQDIQSIDHLKNSIKAFGDEWMETPSYLKRKEGPLRIAIDKVFTLTGHGTVVTGHLLSGIILQEEELEIYPQSIKVRVRQIQAYGQSYPSIAAPSRIAINLRNVKVDEVRKGHVLGRPGELKMVKKVYAKVRFLKSTQSLSFLWHAATSKTAVTLKHDKDDTFFIHFSKPQTFMLGERFILRQDTTVGGGEIIEPITLQKNIQYKNSSKVFISLDQIQKNAQRIMDAMVIAQDKWEPGEAKMVQEKLSLPAQEFQEAFKFLLGEKKVFRLSQGLYFSYDRHEKIKEFVKDFFRTHREMRVSDVKSIFGVSRKYAIPYLEFFDEKKWTLRQADVRVPWKILEE